MVRLKGIVGSGNQEGQEMFQFQYGAIKGLASLN